MYGLVWSCMVSNGWSCVVLYCPVWSFTVWSADFLYALLCACMYVLVLSSMVTYFFTVIHSFLFSCIVLYGHVRSLMVPCGLVQSCMTMYDLVCFYMFLFGLTLSNMVWYDSVCSHTNLFDLRSYAQRYMLVRRK